MVQRPLEAAGARPVGIAKAVKRRLHYLTFYRSWSRVTHAADVRRFSEPLADFSGHTLRPLRESRELLEIVKMATHFMLECREKMVEHFREGEGSFSRWCTGNVRERFLWLHSQNPMTPPTPTPPPSAEPAITPNIRPPRSPYRRRWPIRSKAPSGEFPSCKIPAISPGRPAT